MKRTKIRSYCIASIALMSAAPFFGANQKNNKENAKKPNLLFIITDQQRFDALGIVGAFPFLRTPNLDRLAERGVRFANSYTTCAVSAPARTSILTGLLVEHHGMLKNEFVSEDPAKIGLTDKKSFDQILVENGYYSEYHGKYHTASQWNSPYSEFIPKKNKKKAVSIIEDDQLTYSQFLNKYMPDATPKEGELVDDFFKMPYAPNPMDRRYGKGSEIPKEELAKRKHAQPDNHGQLMIPDSLSITSFQAKETIAALKRAKQSKKPFSITCSFLFPHAPMLPTKPYYGMYPVSEMPVPFSIDDPHTYSPYKNQNGRNILCEYADKDKIKYMMSDYFGLITEVDHWVGEILKTLDEIGETDNTMVIFTSDHGEMLGAHGMREKNVFYEESARVPLIIAYPKQIKPAVVERYVSSIDLFPTIMDYLGISSDKRDGVSLRPAIEGKLDGNNGFVVTEWLYNGITQPNYMIVKDGWKLYMSYSPKSNVIKVLHNLQKDPHEMVNLLGGKKVDAQSKAKAKELTADLINWLSARNSKNVEELKQISFD